MMPRITYVSVAIALLLVAGHAHAHIVLRKPGSWIQEDSLGGPQKDGPCGPGPTEGQGTETNTVTTFTEGQEITVEWTETVPHNGHFRIALAKDRSELADPKITGNCQSAAISDPPVLPILADGLFKTTSDDGKRDFSQNVKLPTGMTCDKCTLQVLQFMTPHGAPCLYYHCANIKIVAANGAAGSGGAGTGNVTSMGGSGGSRPVAGAGATLGTGGGGAAGTAESTSPTAGSKGAAGVDHAAAVSGGASASNGSAGVRSTAGTGVAGNLGPITADPGGADDGCSVTPTLGAEKRSSAWLMLFSIAFAWLFRRKLRTNERSGWLRARRTS